MKNLNRASRKNSRKPAPSQSGTAPENAPGGKAKAANQRIPIGLDDIRYSKRLILENLNKATALLNLLGENYAQVQAANEGDPFGHMTQMGINELTMDAAMSLRGSISNLFLNLNVLLPGLKAAG